MTTPTDKSEVSLQVENYELKSRLANADRVLERLGYRHCDIPACNCNSYHRWKEESDQLTDLRAQVERLHADGAVMRGALESCRHDGPDSIQSFDVEKVILAQSKKAGADLLARYREAVQLLKWAEPPMVKRDAWMTRWNTLLATVKGDL